MHGIKSLKRNLVYKLFQFRIQIVTFVFLIVIHNVMVVSLSIRYRDIRMSVIYTISLNSL